MAHINDPNTPTNALAVDANGTGKVGLYDDTNKRALVKDGDPETNTSGIISFGKNDGLLVPMRVDRLGSVASAQHVPLFMESFEGNAIHGLRWTITNTTMAAAQLSTTGLVFNSGVITTINTGYMLRSSRSFIKTQRAPIQAKFRARLEHYNNSVMELGFGDAATFNGINTTGAYWQMTAAGVLQPVVTFNSSDTTGTDIRSLININNYYTFDVIVDDDEAIFTCQDTSTGLIISRQSLKLPLTGIRLWSTTQLPILARLYNTASAPATAPRMYLTDVYCALLDANQIKSWSTVMANQDRGPIAHPFTGAQLAQWTNSGEPASATLSNTAAGYTTLGGRFQFAALAGAATDYALFGFTVPAPSTLVVTGIDIDTWNVGAAVATTPTLLTWAVAGGSTAVSLATATATRIGLGSQVLAVATPIGGQADRRISKTFQTPITVGGGRFFHIILRMPVGTATASQIIAGMVNVEGYFE